MNQLVFLYAYLVGLLIVGAGFLHLLSHLGAVGEKTSKWFCSAPGVDLALAYFMLLPLLVGWFVASWQGLEVALLAELSALWLWIILHELAHRQKSQAKIHRQLSSTVGAWRNHLAVWITALAVPLFWGVRFVELIVYPPLTKLVGLPRYDAKNLIGLLP
jgi:hypothetical protein